MAKENIVIAFDVQNAEAIAKATALLSKLSSEEKLAQSEIEKTSKKFKDQSKEVGGLEGSFKSIGGVIAGAFTVGALLQFGKSVINITGEFQKFSAVLENTLGSQSKAKKALEDIQAFAAQTPFSVAELTESFVKLANQGFVPTTTEMRKLGDLASSTGKSFGQLSEAIVKSQTGEFEMLKEFGITASKQGDQVSFAFKGVKTQVDFTSDSIQKYVLGLGDLAGVSGSMEAISGTLVGQISNLGDNFDALQRTIGNSSSGLVSSMIALTSDGLAFLNKTISDTPVEILQKEQFELNTLVNVLKDVNTSENDRKGTIDAIIRLYPDFFKGMDLEKLKTSDITEKLDLYNTSFEKSILLKQKESLLSDSTDKKNANLEDQYELILKIAQSKAMVAEAEKKLENQTGISASTTRGFIKDQLFDQKNMATEVAILKAEGLKLDEEIAQKTKVFNEAFKIQSEDVIDIEKKKREEADVTAAAAEKAQRAADSAADKADKIAEKAQTKAEKVKDKAENDAMKGVELAEKLANEQTKAEEESLEAKIEAKTKYDKELADLSEIQNAAMEEQQTKEVDASILKTEMEVANAEREGVAAENLKNAKLKIGNDLLTGAIMLSGKNTALAKSAAVVQIAINTSVGIAEATKAGAGLIFPANLAAIAIGIGAVLAGIGQAKAAGIFEDGGKVGGKRHTDGGTLIEAEVGEHVMSRRATAKYGHLMFDKMNDLTFDINDRKNGSMVVNLSSKELAEEFSKRPQNNISLDENGFTIRQNRMNSVLIKKAKRYASV